MPLCLSQLWGVPAIIGVMMLLRTYSPELFQMSFHVCLRATLASLTSGMCLKFSKPTGRVFRQRYHTQQAIWRDLSWSEFGRIVEWKVSTTCASIEVTDTNSGTSHFVVSLYMPLGVGGIESSGLTPLPFLHVRSHRVQLQRRISSFGGNVNSK